MNLVKSLGKSLGKSLRILKFYFLLFAFRYAVELKDGIQVGGVFLYVQRAVLPELDLQEHALHRVFTERLVKDKVAKGISYKTFFINFRIFDDMRMVADNQFRAMVHRAVCQIFLPGIMFGLVFIAPVEGDDEKIHLAGGILHDFIKTRVAGKEQPCLRRHTRLLLARFHPGGAYIRKS